MKLGRWEVDQIHAVDVLEGLAGLPDQSVQTCVTSPPYWALRDYGLQPREWPAVTYSPMPGLPSITVPAETSCLGLEATPEAFVGHLVLVYREVKRVLKDDGVAWINLGDTYAGGGKTPSKGDPVKSKRIERGSGRWGGGDLAVVSLPRKSLVGIPWRVAFALQADGWILRQDVIWSKSNPMPGSQKDRCTTSHEYVFQLVKRKRYTWYRDQVLEDVAESSRYRLAQDVESQQGSLRDPGLTRPKRAMKAAFSTPAGWDQGEGGHGRIHRDRRNGAHGEGVSVRGVASSPAVPRNDLKQDVMKRNPRSVWTFGTKPFKAAHFAVFPDDLPKRCILAATQEGDVVLDIFGGSGTTGLAARDLGRHYILFDASEEYVETIAKPRLAQVGLVFVDQAA